MDDLNLERFAAMRALYPELGEELLGELGTLGRAPLAQLIDQMLEASGEFKGREALALIAELNQGDLDDLGFPAFRSAIIRKTGLSTDAMRDAVQRLRTYLTTLQASDELLVAARGDDQIDEATSQELNKLLRRRK